MASTPVEVKKAAPAPTTTPDVWRSFRSEMDRVFRPIFRQFRHAFAAPDVRYGAGLAI